MSSGNIGKKWTDLEETQLLQQIKEGIEFDEIASLHQRTLGGIKARINKLAHIYKNEGMEMEKIGEVLRLDKLEMDFLFKKEKKSVVVNQLDKQDEVVVEEGSFELLEDSWKEKLDKRMSLLEEKMDKILISINKVSNNMGL